MFFILICINLTFFIASLYSFYTQDIDMGIIYGGFGLIFTLLTVVYYQKKNKKDCSSSGVDCNPLSTLDCGDGDCGGADCGGLDCSCS